MKKRRELFHRCWRFGVLLAKKRIEIPDVCAPREPIYNPYLRAYLRILLIASTVSARRAPRECSGFELPGAIPSPRLWGIGERRSFFFFALSVGLSRPLMRSVQSGCKCRRRQSADSSHCANIDYLCKVGCVLGDVGGRSLTRVSCICLVFWGLVYTYGLIRAMMEG